jgi:inner membrane protein
LSRADPAHLAMDFITQTLLGSVAAQATMMQRLGRVAALVGASAGALPDYDVLLRPLADPALPFELHRHFTHSLVFIPFGAAIAAAPFLLSSRLREKVGSVYLASLIGIATHGVLDNLTSYGTHLLWPFVSHRTSWDAMSIIDPIFTIVLVVGLIAALSFKSMRTAQVALVLCVCYIGFGLVQHARAAAVQRDLAAARGHVIERGRVLPTIGNVILWRSVYARDGRLYADAIRVPPFGSPTVREGTCVPRFTADDLPADLDDPRRVRNVLERFDAFATGFTASIPESPPGTLIVGDVRFSMDTAGFEPIWGVEIIAADPIEPLRWVMMRFDDRAREAMLGRLWNELIGPGVGSVTVESIAAPTSD